MPWFDDPGHVAAQVSRFLAGTVTPWVSGSGARIQPERLRLPNHPGVGLGDRFEVSRGPSRLFEGRVVLRAETAELQEKRGGKRSS